MCTKLKGLNVNGNSIDYNGLTIGFVDRDGFLKISNYWARQSGLKVEMHKGWFGQKVSWLPNTNKNGRKIK